MPSGQNRRALQSVKKAANRQNASNSFDAPQKPSPRGEGVGSQETTDVGQKSLLRKAF
jgi:hypothetical protein